MKINVKDYFDAAEKEGLTPFQLTYTESTETSITVFNNDIESQQIGTSMDIGGKAIFEGKKGSFHTDRIDDATPALMAKEIKASAIYGTDEKVTNYFEGGLEYKKAAVLFDDFEESNLAQLRAIGLEISALAQKEDPRVTKVEVYLTKMEGKSMKANNLGMQVEEASKAYIGYIAVVCEDETKEPRTGGEGFKSFHSLKELKEDGIIAVKKAVKAAVDFFHTGPVESKNYNVVLCPGVVASLLGFYLSQLNAKSVHKHLSVFEGMLEQKIASDKLTIDHTPHVTSLSASSFDADGYPTQDFTILDKGILKDYFYSLETANEDNRKSNGTCSGNGNGDAMVVTVQKGDLSLEELLAKLNDGLYITDVSGLNSGINGQTLEFSVPCSGYVVKDGKIDKAVSMIIMAGNLKALFENVEDLANDVENKGGFFTPSMLVKDLAISGN